MFGGADEDNVYFIRPFGYTYSTITGRDHKELKDRLYATDLDSFIEEVNEANRDRVE